MKEATFEATVQYNDMVGSVSADNSDKTSIQQWLCDTNQIKSGEEIVIGIQLHPSENHGEESGNPVNVTILLIPVKNINTVRVQINSGNVQVQVRRIDTVMTLPQFFSLFKRINLTLSRNENKDKKQGSEFKGILDGVKYQYDKNED